MAEGPFDLPRRVVAEVVGTAFLVATIIGSGIMGDVLSPDDGVALLGNTLATWGILFVLITIFGPVSGAHFNPMVTTTFFLKQELSIVEALSYFAAEFVGAIAGAFIAHGMFEATVNMELFEGKDRDSWGEFFGEVVATFGLLTLILACIAIKKEDQIPMSVGLYITAGYWFTSSTSFANPAVMVGRSFTTTFASINPKSFHVFFGGQVLGLALALPFNAWLFQKCSVVEALKVLLRQPPPALPANQERAFVICKQADGTDAKCTFASDGSCFPIEGASKISNCSFTSVAGVPVQPPPTLPTWGKHYKHNVMFLCNHNSCRSQMADGWLRMLRGKASVGVASAGIVGGTAVKEGAISVMKEVGIDISSFTSDAMADFSPYDFDVVISCCGCGDKLDNDKKVWKKRTNFEDWNLDDPPAIDPGDLSAYRRVRDEAKLKVLELLERLSDQAPASANL